jgi:hypothetical protein
VAKPTARSITDASSTARPTTDPKPPAVAEQRTSTESGKAAGKPREPRDLATAKHPKTADESSQNAETDRSVPAARLSGYQAEAAKLLAGMTPARGKRRATTTRSGDPAKRTKKAKTDE